MIRVLNRLVLPAGIALGLLAGAACSSDTQTIPTAAPNAPTPAPSIREVAENSTTATPSEATPTSTEPGGTEVPGTGAKASFSPLSTVRSFNYTMSMKFGTEGAPDGDQDGSLTLEGAYVAPDRSSLSLTFDVPQMEGLTLPGEVKAVVIGQDVYTNLGGQWQKSNLDGLGLSSLMPTQEQFYQNFSVHGLDGLPFKDEVKNEVQTKHYALTAAQIRGLLSQAASSSEAAGVLDSLKDVSADFWIAQEGGYLVSVDVSGVVDPSAVPGLAGLAGSQNIEGMTVDFGLKFDLTQINSTEIQIEPPV